MSESGGIPMSLEDSGLPHFSTIEDFVFNGPLYAQFVMANNSALGLFKSPAVIDGHCIHCGSSSTFKREHTPRRDINFATLYDDGYYTPIWLCSRSDRHIIRINIRKQENLVWKVGQDPSLADISNDVAREYRKVLTGIDRNEFSKAIGLAAHGVGVGSFVYMRRIFERLILRRQTASGLPAEAFAGKRMAEKILLLKDHLPPFLVENSAIYGVLSRGIHELSEQECLDFYPVMHESIVIILDEDVRRKEEIERRARLSSAITNFKGKDSSA